MSGTSNTELQEAIAELEGDLNRGEYSGGGYHYIEADPEALRTVLAALSTPPADDVREALIDAMIDVEVSGGMVEFDKDDRADAAYLADAILADSRIEVRPREVVTLTADDVREALVTLHRPVEIEPSNTICGECSWQLPNGRYFGKVVEYPCPTLDALAEVRPRGTVTEAEVDPVTGSVTPAADEEWEYGVDDMGKHPEGAIWAYRGEKRLINLATTLKVPGRLRHWYGVDAVYRRRAAGPWELFDIEAARSA